jgi:hypothetical protein
MVSISSGTPVEHQHRRQWFRRPDKRGRDRRGRLLRAALGFAGCSTPSYALRSWLDSWSGIGRVAVGIARQGYDLQLTRYDDKGWRATFYTTGMEHSPTSAIGTGWERTPWHATQRRSGRLGGNLKAPPPWPSRLTLPGVWTVVNLAFTAAATREARESLAIPSWSRRPSSNPEGGPRQWNISNPVRWSR